jgi:hypothetical protein
MTGGRADKPLRVAMWSGPRNISTAMMRSWGNRPDTFVCDEPLYAHYLSVTRRDHPGGEEVIAAGETDVRKVIEWLLGPVPSGAAVFYQKHMSHHLIADVPREWLRHVTNCFLIREPREVLTSLVKHVPDAKLADTGYAQQAELYDLVRGWTGKTPTVIDARDVLNNPRRVLGGLCEALGVEFTDAMLSWPPGLRATDGVWAKYWYKEVETTTSFRPYKPKDEPVPHHMREILDICERHYQRLYEHRIA